MPTVKITGKDGQVADYTGLAAVSEIFWPEPLTQPREGRGYQHLLEILQQDTPLWTHHRTVGELS